MEKYYYDVRGVLNDTCIEPCKVKDNGIMIGSCKCQECEHCIESSSPKDMWENWIKCSKLKEARGQ
jgi:hypothetical protein